jgi:hypothetical protein
VNENYNHMSSSDSEKLLKLLTEFEDLFDGTLGNRGTEPVSSKGKEQSHITIGLFQLQNAIKKL